MNIKLYKICIIYCSYLKYNAAVAGSLSFSDNKAKWRPVIKTGSFRTEIELQIILI